MRLRLLVLIAGIWAAAVSNGFAGSLLPMGQQQFVDANGAPLAAGQVCYYFPGTTNAKTTWLDRAQTTANAGPCVTLNSAGRAVVWGYGLYRQMVYDSAGNLIWDQPVSDYVSDVQNNSFSWGGTSTGSANSQSITVAPAPPAYSAGQIFEFLAGYTNTGALFLNVNGLGAQAVVKPTSSGPAVLAGGEVVINNDVIVEYIGSEFQLLSVNAPAACSTGAAGLVPATGGGTTNFLRADCTFASIPRQANPSVLYVAVGGSDSNNCLSVAKACATVQGAINLAATTYDLQGKQLKISIGAGTFDGGVDMSGPPAGGAGGNSGGFGFGGYILLQGAGSASTFLANTSCTNTVDGILAQQRAQVLLGSLTVSTTCAGGVALDVYNYAFVELSDNFVNFGAAPKGVIEAQEFGQFDTNFHNWTMSGNSAVGIISYNHGTVSLSDDLTLSGTPAFTTAFIQANDHGTVTTTTTGPDVFVVTGTATGPRYVITNGSLVDFNTNAQLPGSSVGQLGAGGRYNTQLKSCVGGASGCAVTNVPTGLGTGGSETLSSSSGDWAGDITLATGSSGAASTGYAYVGLVSRLQGGQCTASPGLTGTTIWAAGTTLSAIYSESGNVPMLQVYWQNGGGSALGNSTTYDIVYQCGTSP